MDDDDDDGDVFVYYCLSRQGYFDVDDERDSGIPLVCCLEVYWLIHDVYDDDVYEFFVDYCYFLMGEYSTEWIFVLPMEEFPVKVNP